MFYKSPHDLRKLMIAGQNTLYFMAKISQWCVNNACDLNMHESKELNALEK